MIFYILIIIIIILLITTKKEKKDKIEGFDIKRNVLAHSSDLAKYLILNR
jgi:hypothetical protein